MFLFHEVWNRYMGWRHENIDSTSKFLHATIFHHQAVAVGENRRKGFIVADNDDGHIGTLLDEGVIELLPVEGIEVGIWLVKQEKFGTAHEGTAEKRSLPLRLSMGRVARWSRPRVERVSIAWRSASRLKRRKSDF